MDTTRRMHSYLANAGPLKVETVDIDSERKAGGVRKSWDTGGHATLRRKWWIPLASVWRDASVRIHGPKVAGTFPTYLYRIHGQISMAFRRGQNVWVPHRRRVSVRRSSPGFQRCELKSLLSQPLILSWRLSEFMMSMPIHYPRFSRPQLKVTGTGS